MSCVIEGPYQQVMIAADLEASAEVVWAHALLAARRAGGRLTAVHVRTPEHPEQVASPNVAVLLERWGLGAGTVEVDYRSLAALDPRANLPWEMMVEDPDLVVLGTHRRQGIDRLWRGSVGEYLARNAPHAALVVPDGVRPIVAPDGSARLRRILVPLAHEVFPQCAVDRALQLARSFGTEPGELILLHDDPQGSLPEVTVPEGEGWTVRTELRAGHEVVGHILEVAVRDGVDCVVMVTLGHDSVGDLIFGSHTDRVIREAPCPVLVVPAPEA